MKYSEKYRFKISVIGDGGVGKTTLIQKFTHGTFQKEYLKTVGAQISDYKKEINQDKILLLFWDIAGQDDFLFLRPTFYKASHAVIIVFSLEENDLGKRSFENIKKWYEDVQNFCGAIPVVLFANKVDLINDETINESEIQNFVKENKFFDYYITSAKTGQGVDTAFTDLIECLYNRYKSMTSEL
ncbi:MAG: Rab family GTPase [Candidatus Thorarchaeota archaeon]